MMKKVYLSPTIDIVKVQMMQMLAESVPFGQEDVNANDAQSRDYDMDDDWD